MQHSIYRDEILEHYHTPQNYGKLPKFNISAKQVNPFCGDELEMFLQITENKITDISFQGRGCVISIAAASLLTEFVKNEAIGKLTKLGESDMLNLINIEISDTRKKCLMLSLAVLQESLINYAI